MTNQIKINERVYLGIPSSSAIVICLDGSQKEYFEKFFSFQIYLRIFKHKQ